MMFARDMPKPEAYGVPVVYAAGDVNRDGVCDGFDPQDWDDYNDYGAGALAADLDVNRDGVVDSADRALVQGHADWVLWTSHGRGSVSRMQNRRGYAGYEYDPATQQWHVRHRVLVSEMGRWNRRDPLGYVDGMSVYEYVGSRAVKAVDPSGLAYDRCTFGECTVDQRMPIDTGPSDLECPPGWYFNEYVKVCVPIRPIITPAPPKDRKPSTPREEICAWACDQAPGVWGAVTCLNGQHVVCNCVDRKFGPAAGRGYARHLSSCINQCERAHIPNLNCSINGGLGGWVGGERGRVRSECAVNTCVRDCMQKYNCANEPENRRSFCEIAKRQGENNMTTWCNKCDRAGASE